MLNQRQLILDLNISHSVEIKIFSHKIKLIHMIQTKIISTIEIIWDFSGMLYRKLIKWKTYKMMNWDYMCISSTPISISTKTCNTKYFHKKQPQTVIDTTFFVAEKNLTCVLRWCNNLNETKIRIILIVLTVLDE